MYKDKIYIWNDGEMPEDMDSMDKLFMKHSSKPYNPKHVNVFFMSGMIGARGREFEKARNMCKYGCTFDKCDKHLEFQNENASCSER